jgi:serine protease Do
LPDQNGALVDDVGVNTPAEKAGIQSGDAIVEFNGKKVTDANGLQLAVSECSPGSEATLKLIREGAARTIKLKLAERPNEIEQSRNEQGGPVPDNSKTDALNGVTVADLSPQIRGRLDFPDNLQGVMVTDVDPDSNAADAGLQRNDIIVEINQHPVPNAHTAVELYKQARGSQITLRIWRREGSLAGTRYLSVDNTVKGK